MPVIHGNLKEFTKQLNNNSRIECDKKGNWNIEYTRSKINRMLTCERSEIQQLTNLCSAMCNELDTLEREPVLFKNNHSFSQEQKEHFSSYFKAALAVENRVLKNPSAKLIPQINALQQRVIALKYRIESIHGGLNPTITADKKLYSQFLRLAQDWKKEQKLYPAKDKKLSLRDICKIQEVCRYPEFTKMLIKDKRLRDTFFKWTVRDNNGVKQFIEFPTVCARIRSTFLDKRIGYLNPDELSVKKIKNRSDTLEKVICLPFFDGEKVCRMSILDESQKVELNGNRILSIKEIFDIFSHKNITPGNVEFFGPTGINNWGNHESGWWNPRTLSYVRPDFSKTDWWKQLPIFQILPKKELERQYSLNLNKDDWAICMKSTRESLNFELTGTHGYLELAIPLGKDQYAIYPFGKHVTLFPTRTVDQLKMVTQTVQGKIGYPDENPMYSQRQHALFPKILKATEGVKVLDEIKKDIIASTQGNIYFQLSGENCAHWAQSKFALTEGGSALNLFRMQVINMQPTNAVLNAIIHLPDLFKPYINVEPYIMGLFHYFATKGGRTVTENGKETHKVTLFAKTYKDQYQYQPDLLPRKIEDKTLPGHIYYGN